MFWAELKTSFLSIAAAMTGQRELTPAQTGAMFAAGVEARTQQHFLAEIRALQAFLRRTGADYATPSGCPRTNIVDQGDKKTYDLPPPVLAELFDRLEACRRAGGVTHFSERQATAHDARSGLYIDLDMEHFSPEPVLGPEQYECLAGHVGGLLAEMFAPAADGAAVPGSAAAAGSAAMEYDVFFTAKGEPVPLPMRPGAAAEGAAAEGADAAGATGQVYDDGVHILVPGAQLTRPEKRLFFQQLGARGAMEDAFEGIPLAMDPADVLDHASAASPALFFGSAKKGRAAAYNLTAAYRVRVRAAASGRPGRVSTSCLDVAAFERPIAEGGANLVAELALGAGATPPRYPEGRPPVVRRAPLEIRETYRAMLPDESAADTAGVAGAPTPEESLSALCVVDPRAQNLHEILALLPVEKYVADYDNWRRVVFALAHTSGDYLPLAEWFTQRSPDKTAEAGSSRPEKLHELWAVARAEAAKARAGGGAAHRPVTIRSIEYWARQESPEEYRKVAGRGYYNYLGDMVFDYGGRLQHAHVAKLLSLMLGDKFVVDVKPNSTSKGASAYVWYEFVVPGDEHIPGQQFKWREEPEPSTLLNYLSDVVPSVYRQMLDNLGEQRDAAADDPTLTAGAVKEKTKYLTGVAKALASARGQLNNSGYKSGVLREALHRFRRRGFAESLDTLPDVMGVGNGVLHIASEQRPRSVLIRHYHELPVSRFTRTAFIPYDAGEKRCRYLLAKLAEAVPEADAREKLLFHFSCALSHDAEAVMFYFWGGGSNGKTTFARLTAKAVGEYGTKILMALLTEPITDPSKPNSAIMRLKDRTYAYCDESYAGATLQETTLKRIVNEGDVTERDLNSKQEEFPVTWTVTALSNHKLGFKTTDHGTWRRIQTYHFKVRFVDDPDAENPYERQKDPEFMRRHVKDPDYQVAWFSILNHYWERLVGEYGGEISRVPSPTIERETTQFRIARDTLHRFLIERFIVVDDPASAYAIDTVAQRYIEWHHRAVGRMQIVPENVIDRLENSVVKGFIRRKANGSRHLVGCRLLEEGDLGELGPGEKFLGGAREVEVVAAAAAADAPAVSAVEDFVFVEDGAVDVTVSFGPNGERLPLPGEELPEPAAATAADADAAIAAMAAVV